MGIEIFSIKRKPTSDGNPTRYEHVFLYFHMYMYSGIRSKQVTVNVRKTRSSILPSKQLERAVGKRWDGRSTGTKERRK
jgi:hypothetical protein